MKKMSYFVSIVILGWFWGDPHFKTLDGGNYTFNGLGEYVMIDAQNATFQLQARTGLAQGNSTTATIFTAGAAKEENTSTIEVRVKEGGEGQSVWSYTTTNDLQKILYLQKKKYYATIGKIRLSNSAARSQTIQIAF